MYQMQHVDLAALAQVEVLRQEQITKELGQPFDPLQSFRIIQRDTGDFTLETEEGKKADQLFMEFLLKNGIEPSSEKVEEEQERERIKLQAKARERDLQLLKIKLKLKKK